jgi:hypothetical protein
VQSFLSHGREATGFISNHPSVSKSLPKGSNVTYTQMAPVDLLSTEPHSFPLDVAVTSNSGQPMFFFLQTPTGLVSLDMATVYPGIVILTEKPSSYAYKGSPRLPPTPLKREESPHAHIEPEYCPTFVDTPPLTPPRYRAPDANVRERRQRMPAHSSTHIAEIFQARSRSHMPPALDVVKTRPFTPAIEAVKTRPFTPVAEIIKARPLAPGVYPEPQRQTSPRRGGDISRPLSSTSCTPMARTPSGVVPDPAKKVYCTHWINNGTCGYTQTGCKYLHKLPPRELWHTVGIKEHPQWMLDQDKTRVGIDSAPHPEMDELAKSLEEMKYENRIKRVPAKPKVVPAKRSPSRAFSDELESEPEAQVDAQSGLDASKFAAASKIEA